MPIPSCYWPLYDLCKNVDAKVLSDAGPLSIHKIRSISLTPYYYL